MDAPDEKRAASEGVERGPAGNDPSGEHGVKTTDTTPEVDLRWVRREALRWIAEGLLDQAGALEHRFAIGDPPPAADLRVWCDIAEALLELSSTRGQR